MSAKIKLRFKSKILKILLGLGVLILLSFSGIYFYVQNALQPVVVPEDTVVEIETGTTFTEVTEILEDKNIIKDGQIFRYYASYQGFDRQIQAGEYLFSGELHPDDVLSKLRQGEVIDQSIRFTIPEGLRADQVAERLARQDIGDEEKFLELFQSDDWDYWFLEHVNRDESKFYLEGFLYPETYQVNKEATEVEVVETMLNQFETVFNSHFQEKAEAKAFNIVEIITIASIIEREAVNPEERQTISGVFHNRLTEGMLLQACATVEYVLQENKPVLSTEDTKIQSPYNTYQNQGLPPGPIASPGKASIDAALEPETHDYKFFVAKQDGSGSHVFSETYEEHLQAKQEIRAGQE